VKTTLTEVAPDAVDAPHDDPAEDLDGDRDDAAGETDQRTLGPKVKLSVEVDEEQFEEAIDAAFRKIGREVRIQGFRPGKVPRKVLESRIGSGYARAQALEDALPEYYAEAVRDNGVDVIASPEFELTGGEESGPVTFDAVVEVRPSISVTGYSDIEVEIPNPIPSDDEVQEQIDAQRLQSAELVDVERAAAEGDQVSIDIDGSVEGESLPGLNAEDFLYEVGSGGIVDEVDAQLTGTSAGDELSFSAPHPVQEDVEIDFEITVKVVKEQVLPELTDEWVEENTEHDTVEELRAQTSQRMRMMRSFQANSAVRENTATSLAELVTDPVPDSLVNGQMSDQLQQLAMSLQQQGMSIEQWMQMSGQDPESFTGELREASERSAKVDLALRAIGVAEALEVDDDDLDEELERLAGQYETTVDDIRHQLEHGDGLAPIRSELLKRKALEWLVEEVKLVDEDGTVIDRSDLELPVDEPTDDQEEADVSEDSVTEAESADVSQDSAEATPADADPSEEDDE
jgi:trigger factor